MFVPEFRTIGLPSELFVIEQGSLDLQSRQTSSDSVFSPFGIAAGLQEQFWTCKAETIQMERETWQLWKSFVARLKGRTVLFEVPALGQSLPLGVGGGFSESGAIVTLTGASLTGATLREGATSALVSEAASRHAEAIILDFGDEQAEEVVLKPGDVFGLGGNLYMSVASVTADGDGVARVPFRTGLWKGASVGDVVNFRNPTFRAQLRDPNGGPVNLTAPLFGKSSFDLVEVPYIS
jgi:hypothetical protein